MLLLHQHPESHEGSATVPSTAAVAGRWPLVVVRAPRVKVTSEVLHCHYLHHRL